MSERQLKLFGDDDSSIEIQDTTPEELGDIPHDLVGGEHELRLDEEQLRKAQGSFYTPPDVVAELLRLTLDPILSDRKKGGAELVRTIRVLDPSCGTGNFLVASGKMISDALVECGIDAEEASRIAYTECVCGVDIDPLSVSLCRAVLSREAGLDFVPTSVIQRIVRSNSLLLPLEDVDVALDQRGRSINSWESLLSGMGAPTGFDLVIGNPPFLGQLRSETKFGPKDMELLAERFGDIAHRYVDPAVLFLFLSTQLVHARGLVCMVQPISSLAVADAARCREAILRTSNFRFVWVAKERVFDAAVDVCAIAIGPSEQKDYCSLFVGRGFEPVGTVRVPDGTTWSPFLARASGVPELNIEIGLTLESIADATADFRDQYYGLVGNVINRTDSNDRNFPPLITSGLIDLLTNRWGTARTKFNKEWFESPCVDVEGLSEPLRAWAKSRLVPKILVATQTKVIEFIVDLDGLTLPSVPVLTLTSKGDSTTDLWKIAAVLLAPPLVALSLDRHLGAGLGSNAIKLSAKQILDLPLPFRDEHWTNAAEILRESGDRISTETIYRAGEEMCSAYGMAEYDELISWWRARLKGGKHDT